ncbi:MAG: hypothetical protein C4526_07815, partial [Nitrospiraceae bacterium]
DIPIAHLSYHAYRYGKIAIGFYRRDVLKHGFNPVFYTLENTSVIQSIYSSLRKLSFIDIDTNNIFYNITDALKKIDVDKAIDIESALDAIENEAFSFASWIDNAAHNFKSFLAFVKTFKEDEFGTIYCEREWRSTKSFEFDIANVAMIVLPKKAGDNNYFELFLKKHIEEVGLPSTVPVVPWEDLVEH